MVDMLLLKKHTKISYFHVLTIREKRHMDDDVCSIYCYRYNSKGIIKKNNKSIEREPSSVCQCKKVKHSHMHMQ